MSGARLIDQDLRTRKRPMRVLVLGLPRTGTTTVCAALRKLGYTPHHMRNILTSPSQLQLWQEAVNLTLLPPSERPIRQRHVPPYGLKEFDKLLGDYDLVADLPGALFAQELIEAYPDAKVILTLRKYEDWEKSMRGSIWLLLIWRLFILCRIANITQIAPLTRLMHSLFHIHNGNNYGGPEAKEAYNRHYDNIRKIIPKDRLLEVAFASDLDWKTLCAFLGTKKPDDVGAYPRVNEDVNMRPGLLNAWWVVVWYLLLWVLVTATAVVGAIAIYWQRELWASFEGWLKKLEPYAGLKE